MLFAIRKSKIQTTRTGQSESLERCINSFYYFKIAGISEKIKKKHLYFIGQNLHFVEKPFQTQRHNSQSMAYLQSVEWP